MANPSDQIFGFNRDDTDTLLDVVDAWGSEPKKFGQQRGKLQPTNARLDHVRVSSLTPTSVSGVNYYPGFRIEQNPPGQSSTWADRNAVLIQTPNGETP